MSETAPDTSPQPEFDARTMALLKRLQIHGLHLLTATELAELDAAEPPVSPSEE